MIWAGRRGAVVSAASAIIRLMTFDPSALKGSGNPVPFDPDALSAIRRRLNEICDAAQESSDEPSDSFAAVRAHSEPRQLAETLAAWGERAEPAIPELVRLLSVRPLAAAPALAAIGRMTLESAAMLRRVAATADGYEGVYARLAAARAVRSLTGSTEPLLAAIQYGLTTPGKSPEDPDDRAAAADAALELPEHADLLVPLLLQALQAIRTPTPSVPAHQARLKLGRALWLLTGHPEPVIKVMLNLLDPDAEDYTALTAASAAELAAELAPDLGPSAHELIPGLEAALADPDSAPAAAQALAAIKR